MTTRGEASGRAARSGDGEKGGVGRLRMDIRGSFEHLKNVLIFMWDNVAIKI